MNKHNLSGLDYMVESYLSWRSSEGNIVTREDLNQWIVKNNTQVENIDEIGITLMDLEYGGTTPQQFEKFKKSFKFIKEAYETCKKREPKRPNGILYSKWRLSHSWLQDLYFSALDEIVLVGDRYSCDQHPEGVIYSAWYKIGRKKEYSLMVSEFIINEIFKQNGAILRSSVIIPYKIEVWHYPSGDSLNYSVLKDKQYTFHLQPSFGINKTLFDKWLNERIEACKQKPKNHEWVYKCEEVVQFKDVVATASGNVYLTELIQEQYLSVPFIRPKKTMTEESGQAIVVKLFSRDKQYAENFFEQLRDYVHQQNQSLEK